MVLAVKHNQKTTANKSSRNALLDELDSLRAQLGARSYVPAFAA